MVLQSFHGFSVCLVSCFLYFFKTDVCPMLFIALVQWLFNFFVFNGSFGFASDGKRLQKGFLKELGSFASSFLCFFPLLNSLFDLL